MQLFLSQLYFNQRRTESLLAERATNEDFLNEALTAHDALACELSQLENQHSKVDEKLREVEQSRHELVQWTCFRSNTNSSSVYTKALIYIESIVIVILI